MQSPTSLNLDRLNQLASEVRRLKMSLDKALEDKDNALHNAQDMQKSHQNLLEQLSKEKDDLCKKHNEALLELENRLVKEHKETLDKMQKKYDELNKDFFDLSEKNQFIIKRLRNID